MSENDYTFVLCFVELCTCAIPNVSNIQTFIRSKKPVSWLEVTMFFIRSSVAVTSWKTSDDASKSEEESEEESFCLSHIYRFSFAMANPNPSKYREQLLWSHAAYIIFCFDWGNPFFNRNYVLCVEVMIAWNFKFCMSLLGLGTANGNLIAIAIP